VQAIKKRLIAVGRYKKERREELISMICDWVKAPSIKALEEYRTKLLAGLHNKEVRYIQGYYQPKEY
jgi:hypothetical protein